jgi:sarcosine oxidase subunit gamma
VTGERWSALAAYAPRFAAVGRGTAAGGEHSVQLAELPFRAMATLRLDPRGRAAEGVGLALGTPLPGPGTATTTGGIDVMWLGPDEWLLVGPPDTQHELVARLRRAIGAEVGSVVDASAARTALLVSGPRARDVLAHGCPLDLHARAFGPGRCAGTLLGRERVVLHARDDGILVLVRTSAARYLADWLLDAATEYAR